MHSWHFLERRIFAAEARSLILDRLREPALAHLGRWFSSPRGGDSGAWLLREHPVLDTVLEQGSRSVKGNVMPRPLAVALDQFCCGLLLGAFMQDAGGKHSPFYSPTRIDDVHALMREHSAGVCSLLTLYAKQPTGRVVLNEALHRSWPDIPALLRVTHRMSGAIGPMCQRNRLHFYAGLLGAGVEFRLPVAASNPARHYRQQVQRILFGEGIDGACASAEPPQDPESESLG